MPPALIELIAQLDYTGPLGSQLDNLEVQNLLRIVKNISWDLVSVHNCSRDPVNPRTSLSPGRKSVEASDYVWFNPITRQCCSKEEAAVGRAPWRPRRTRNVAYRDLDAVPSFPSYQSTMAVAKPSNLQSVQMEQGEGTPVIE